VSMPFGRGRTLWKHHLTDELSRDSFVIFLMSDLVLFWPGMSVPPG
jgi:hypothetical protein